MQLRGDQARPIENEPALYYRPAYFGPSGWAGIRLDAGGCGLGACGGLVDAELAGECAEAVGGENGV